MKWSWASASGKDTKRDRKQINPFQDFPFVVHINTFKAVSKREWTFQELPDDVISNNEDSWNVSPVVDWKRFKYMKENYDFYIHHHQYIVRYQCLLFCYHIANFEIKNPRNPLRNSDLKKKKIPLPRSKIRNSVVSSISSFHRKRGESTLLPVCL